MRTIASVLSLGLVVACAGSPGRNAPPTVNREARVVANLVPVVAVRGAPSVRHDLTQRMKRYNTPGVTIAVADSGRIVWARGFGVKEAGTTDSVTPTTIFEAGSISKPVAATITLRMVEQGKLSLDENVNTYLKSWKLPENKFTAKEKVTLRRILSHNAGLTVHGFPGYATTDSVPTVPELLDGKKPANTAAVRVDTTPGAIWRYSGGGTTIEQLVVTDVSGRAFPALAKELVFDPIGMSSSTYEQPLPASLYGAASAAHHAAGTMVPGRYHVYPEMAAAGLWTTPTDLLKWAIEIAAARAGTSTKVLSKQMATDMLTVQKAPVGLGPFLEGSGRAFRFGHGGADEGFHAELVYFPETGQGAAVMVNSDGGPPIIREVLYAIAEEYGWPEFAPRTIDVVAVDSATLERAVGVYQVEKPFPVTVTLSRDGDKLFVECRVCPAGKTQAVPTSPTELVLVDGGNQFKLVVDASGSVTALQLGSFKIPRKSAAEAGATASNK